MPLSGAVLVTGGSGTLGQAIVRTALQERWDCSITIYSRSELRQAQMRAKYPHCRYVLGDVRDYDRLSAAVAGHDVVVHAAAMKRLPEAEQQPLNCIDVNVGGTTNAARACMQHNVKTAVFVSTDKACRACTTYGASKLMGEGIWRSFAEYGHFVAVRYGNVVASNGSVIPIWRAQAKAGQPLTITDPEMTRFWMAESDAVQLVVDATQRSAGVIVVPKMRSLSLREMAHIIALGAEIKTTGLRSVEKRHEDLIHEDEPVGETDTHFWIYPNGSTGRSYTSYDAPRLIPAAFRAMLAEAEAHE